MHLYRVPAGVQAVCVPLPYIGDATMAPLPETMEFEREEIVLDPVSLANGPVPPELSDGMVSLVRHGWYIFAGPDGGYLLAPGNSVEVL